MPPDDDAGASAPAGAAPCGRVARQRRLERARTGAVRVREPVAKGGSRAAPEIREPPRDSGTYEARERARVADAAAPPGGAPADRSSVMGGMLAAGRVEELAGLPRSDPAALAAYDALEDVGGLPDVPAGTGEAIVAERRSEAAEVRGELEPGVGRTDRGKFARDLVRALVAARDEAGLARVRRAEAGRKAHERLIEAANKAA